MEYKIVIPIDFMDLKQIQNEMDIHLTRSYCIELGFAKFISCISVRCLRDSNELVRNSIGLHYFLYYCDSKLRLVVHCFRGNIFGILLNR